MQDRSPDAYGEAKGARTGALYVVSWCLAYRAVFDGTKTSEGVRNLTFGTSVAT
jgi:hypothetical protein